MPGAGDVRAGGAYVEIGTRDSALIRGLASARARVDAFANRVGAIGKRMMIAGGVMLAPLAIAVREQAKFGEEMAKVSTMLGKADMSFLPLFSKSVSEMAVKFGESTGTIAKGLYDILSAGIPASGAIKVLEASMKAAAAGATDTGIAADAVTTILNSFRLSADKATDVADFLFSVVKRGKTDFATLAPSIGMVAATASSAGLRIEEMGAMLATMTRNGVRTEIAVTALNSILSTFLKPTDEAAQVAHGLGFELNTATLKTMGLHGVLRKLQGVPTETIARMFPNVRALRGVLPALQDIAGYTFDMSVMTKRAGATQEAFAKQTNTLAYSMRQAKESFKEFLRLIGKELEPKMLEYVSRVKDIVAKTKEWIAENDGAVVSYAKLAVQIVAVGAALWGLEKALKAVGFLLSPLGIFLGAGVAILGMLEHYGVIDVGLGRYAAKTKARGRSLAEWWDVWGLKVRIGFLWVVGELAKCWAWWKMQWKIGGEWMLRFWASFTQSVLHGFILLVESIAKALDWIVRQLNKMPGVKIDLDFTTPLQDALRDTDKFWKGLHKGSIEASKSHRREYTRSADLIDADIKKRMAVHARLLRILDEAKKPYRKPYVKPTAEETQEYYVSDPAEAWRAGRDHFGKPFVEGIRDAVSDIHFEDVGFGKGIGVEVPIGKMISKIQAKVPEKKGVGEAVGTFTGMLAPFLVGSSVERQQLSELRKIVGEVAGTNKVLQEKLFPGLG